MEKGKGEFPAPSLAVLWTVLPCFRRSIFRSHLLISTVLAFAGIAGCAAPGDPTPPHPPVPQAVTDLSAHQAGDTIVLAFTVPKAAVDNQPLSEAPAVEIFRSFVSANAASAAAAPPKEPTYTIPSALVSTYEADGRMRFSDPIKPEDLVRHAGEQAVYFVRTRASKKKDSEASNSAALRVYPSPESIGEVRLQVTKSALELSWSPPTRTTSGAPIAALGGYHVYRAEVTPGAEAEAEKDPSKAKLLAPLDLLGVAPAPHYRDAQFEFGHTYVYSVRSVAQYEADSVESGDSSLAIVTPLDKFPPDAPQDLLVTLIPANGGVPAHPELSWGISPATDVVGYNVYRSDQAGSATRGEKLNRELLPTPAFRDMSAVPGRPYSYVVTAVDRAGNESSPSAPVSVVVPAEAEKARP
jgi:hypothetical protein